MIARDIEDLYGQITHTYARRANFFNIFSDRLRLRVQTADGR